MSNRFKILVLGAFIAMSAFHQLAEAQTEYYYSVSQPLCATGEDGNSMAILSDGKIGAQTFNSSVSTWRVQEISLYEIDENGDVVNTIATVTTSVSSPYISSQIGSLVQFRLESAINGAIWSNNVLTSGFYRLHQLTIWPNALPIDMFGKTLRIFVKFGSSASSISSTLSYDIEVAGAPTLQTSSATYDEDNDVWVKQVCKGENVELSVDNGQYPLGTIPSYLGYTYEASYSWSLRKFGEGTIIDNYANGISVSASDLTTGGSEIFSFTPYIVYTEYKDGVETGKSCTVKMSPINVQYDSEVDLELSLDGNLTNSLKVCSGDEVTATFNVKKDGDYLYDGKVEFYKEEDGVYNLVSTFDDLLSDDSFDLGVIEAKDKKNTKYNYKVIVYDFQENLVKSQCSKEFTFDITAIETDAQITFSDPGEVCEDGTVAISASITGENVGTYTYLWSGVDCTINTTDATNGYYFSDSEVSYNGGARTYRLTVSNEGCETYKDIEVTTNERPILTAIEAEVEDCYGEDIEIGVTSTQADVTYTWTPTDGSVVAGSNGAKRLVPVDYTKTYSVTAVNNTTGCTTKNPATITVTMNSLPDVTYVGATLAEICYGASTNLTASLTGGTGTITYHWSWNDGTDHSQTTTTPTLTITPETSTTVTVYATDSKGCEGASKTVDITVKDLPTFTTTTVDACDGESGTFTFSDNTLQYTVESVNAPTGTGISVSGNVCTVNYVAASLTAVKTYKFNVTGKNTTTGCETTNEVSMKVNPLPSATATVDDDNICLGDKIKLTATTTASGVTYEWKDETSTVIGSTKTLNYEPATVGTHTYTVTITKTATGCKNTASVVVTVNSLPDVDFNAAPSEMCEGETTTLTATVNDGTYTYTWSGGTVTGSGYQVTAKPTSTTTYKMYVTDANGCKSAQTQKTVTVNKKPVITLDADPAEVCAGSTTEVVLTVTQTNSSESTIANYKWNGSTVTTVNTFTVSETWSVDKMLSVVVTSDKGCESATKTITVQVNPKPATPVATATPTAICKDSGDEVTLAVTSPVSGYRYEWYNSSSVHVGTGTTQTVTPNASETYTVYAFDDNYSATKCQSDGAVVSVSVVDNPDAPLVSQSATTICSADGTSVTLSISNVQSGLTYKWYKSDNTYVGEGTSIVVSPTTTTAYYAKAVNSTDCESLKSDNLTVKVDESPTLSMDESFVAVCAGYVRTMSVIATGSNIEYHWSVDESTHLSDNSIDYEGVSAGSKTITVYAVDTETNCTSNTIEFNFEVKAKPVYSISPDESLRHVCEGESIDLTVTHNASIPIITWKEDGVKIGNGESINITPKKGSTYSINVSDFGTSCDIEEDFVLDVFSNPDVSVVGSDEYCIGSTIDVELVPNDAAVYTSWKWTKDGLTYSNTSKLNITNATAEHDGTYEVEVTNASGCVATVEVPITVYDKPTTTINGNDYVCKGGSFTLESAGTFVAYSWVVAGSEVSTEKTLTDFDASSYSVGDNIVVSLYVTDSQGCVSEAITKTITVRELPILTIANKEYCLNEGGNMAFEATLTNPQSGSTYTYYWSVNGGAAEATTTNTYAPAVTLENAGTWTVYAVENETGCEGEETSFSVLVHEVNLTTVATETIFCKDSGTALTATSTVTTDEDESNCTYTYTLLDASDNTIDSQNGSSNSYTYSGMSDMAIGTYTLKVSVETAAHCVAEVDEITLNVVASPGTTLTTETVCVGADVVFTADENATKWEFFVDGVSQGEQTSNIFSANGLTAGAEVYAVLTLGTCEVTSDKAYVSYYASFEPEATFTLTDNVCQDAPLSYTLTSTTLNIESFKVYINGAEYETKILDTPTLTTTYTYTSSDDYNIYFVVTSEEGCEYTTATLEPEMSHVAISNIKITELAGTDDLGQICLDKTYKLSFDAIGGIEKDLGSGLQPNIKFLITTDESVIYDTDETEVDIVFHTAGTHSIDFSIIDLNVTGLCIKNFSHSVEVKELPEATLTVTSHTPVSGNIYSPCDGEQLLFEVTGSIFTLNVNGTDVDSDSRVEVSGNTFTTNFSYDDGEQTIYVTVTDPLTGCQSVSNSIVIKPYDAIEFTTNDPVNFAIVDGQIEICQNNSFTIYASADDVATDSYKVLLDGTEVATGVSSYDYIGTSVGTQTVTFVSPNECQSDVVIKTSEAPNPAVEVYTIDENGNQVVAEVIGTANKICSGDELIITTTGGNAYTAIVTRDGNDVTSEFVDSYAGTTFAQQYTMTYIENGADYNEYVFSYEVKVGTCVDYTQTTVRVYRPVVATLSVPSSTIIAGNDVLVTITEGYDLYEYYVDGILVTSQDNSNPTNYTYSVSGLEVGTATILVKVTSEYGCSLVLTQDITILEGIAPLDVYVSNDYYCSEDDGVTISIPNPQVGITYRLGVGSETDLKACTTCSEITYDGTNGVEYSTITDGEGNVISVVYAIEWQNIKIQDENNPTTYSVYAYHSSLPDEGVMMNNSVDVNEVKTPDVKEFRAEDTEGVERDLNFVHDHCTDDLLKVKDTEVGVKYVLYIDGVAKATIVGDGTDKYFSLDRNIIGVYNVVGYTTFAGNDEACAKDMNGTYTIDLPKATEYNIYTVPENGNFCVNNAEGVEIRLDGSEEGKIYYLYKEGSAVPVQVDGVDVAVEGTGSDISLGHFTDPGNYTVSCIYNDCMSDMLGIATITMYDLPDDQTVIVSNDGHYCAPIEGADPDGLYITVGGQQEGYLYTLYLNNHVLTTTDSEGNELNVSHIGDDSGASFDFFVTEAGTYTVKVTIPNVEDGCEKQLETSIDVVVDELPNSVNMSFAYTTLSEELTICESSGLDAEGHPSDYATIHVTNVQDGVTYTLYNGATVVDTHVETDGDHYFTFDYLTLAGQYYIVAEREITIAEGITHTCTQQSANATTLTVVARPLSGGQVESVTIDVEPAAKVAIDPCYGADVIVSNAQEGLTYVLYLLSEKNGDKVGQEQSIKADDSGEVVFENIQSKDSYYVIAVFNDYCEDDLADEIYVDINKYVAQQIVVAENKLCHGDVGNIVSLAGSELGAIYKLYKGESINDDTKVQLDEIVGTGSSVSFSYPINEEARYIVTGEDGNGCPIQMYPSIDLLVNPLPISYELVGATSYCDEEGVALTLNGSELGVDYILYKHDGTALKYVQTIKGSGSEITFDAVKAGTYEATARNAETECTSSMKGVITIVERTAVADLETIGENRTIVSCSDYTLTYDSNLTVDATYYLVSEGGTIADAIAVSDVSDGATAIEFTLTETGSYEVIGAYVGSNGIVACEHVVSNVIDFEKRIPQQFTLTAENSCEGNATLTLASSEVGIEYYIVGSDLEHKIGDGLPLTWTITGDGVETFEVYAKITTDEDVCEYPMTSTASVDFSKSVKPEVVLSVMLNGVEQTYTETDPISVSVSDALWLIGECDNVTVATYTYSVSDIDGEGNATPNAELTQTLAAKTFYKASNLTKGSLYRVTLSGTTVANCEFEANSVLIYVKPEPEQFAVTSANSCEGTAEIILEGSEVGVSYYVKDHDELAKQEGTGDKLTWTVEGEGLVTYQVYATTTNEYGTVEVPMANTVTIDFSLSVKPESTILLMMNGEEQNTADIVSICPSAIVWLKGETENVSVKEYTYTFYETIDDTTEVLVIGLTTTLSANKFYKKTDFIDGKMYRVEISGETQGGCQFEVGNVYLKIEGSSDADNHLISITSDYDYCEGSPSVQLAYDFAYAGVTYRLWRYTEDDMSDLELMDIQEIPQYPNGKQSDKTHANLMFDGWAYSQSSAADSLYKAYATAGKYFVTYENGDGCETKSNVVTIIENPLPKQENQEVYYAVVDKNGDIDEDTRNDEYGILAAGRVILTNARIGVKYQLVHVAAVDTTGLLLGDIVLDEQTTNTDGTTLIFGPISDSNEDIQNGWGEGTYVIHAINIETGCEVDLGVIEFVDDGLVAYDLTLYVSASQSGVQQLLIPAVGHKGNHKYIDWSSKIDMAYMPKVEVSSDGSIAVLDEGEEYTTGIGYTKTESKANIVFVIDISAVKVELDAWEAGCDSVRVELATGEYTYYKTTDDGATKIICAKDDNPTDSVEVVTYIYKYFKVEVPSYYGTFGFNDYDGTDNLVSESKTGRFVYRKAPRFYGIETIPYYIYNEKYANGSRKSNTAYITIICGNEAIPGDTTALFLIPNAISPNGDGLNDDFEIVLPPEYEENHTSKLEVYNRWGTLVYRSSGLRYGRDCPNWDGTSKTANMLTLGNDLPQGTYFYVFTIDFNIDGEVRTKKLHGYVELRR